MIRGECPICGRTTILDVLTVQDGPICWECLDASRCETAPVVCRESQ